MPRLEITWDAEDADGSPREVSARTEGARWVFRERAGRFDDWRVVASPSLDDWLALLDGVRRRRQRGRATARDEEGVLDSVRRLRHGNGRK